MKGYVLKKLICSVAFTVFIVSPASYATCVQADMTGLWQIFPTPTNHGRWTIMIKVSDEGQVIGGRFSLTDGSPYTEDLSGDFAVMAGDELIEVNKHCRVTSRIISGSNIERTEIVAFFVEDSRLTPDGQTWSGYLGWVELAPSYGGAAGNHLFTAVRVR